MIIYNPFYLQFDSLKAEMIYLQHILHVIRSNPIKGCMAQSTNQILKSKPDNVGMHYFFLNF